MRGNRLARGGDPMKTRSQKRQERKEKLSRTKRAQRLKSRLGRIAAKKFAVQEDSHTTALMESYILRRKAEREEQRKQREMESAVADKDEGNVETDMVREVGSRSHGRHNGDASKDGDDERRLPGETERSWYKRMKDRRKGALVTPAAAIAAASPRLRETVAKQTHKAATKAQGAAKKSGYYDQKSKRVQTRSLY